MNLGSRNDYFAGCRESKVVLYFIVHYFLNLLFQVLHSDERRACVLDNEKMNMEFFESDTLIPELEQLLLPFALFAFLPKRLEPQFL